MGNPAFGKDFLQKIGGLDQAGEGAMTIEGTINKSGLLLVIAIVGGVLGWRAPNFGIAIGLLLVNLVMGFMITRKPMRAATMSQIYAFFEGYILGAISVGYSEQFPGIVSNAMISTIGCVLLMLALYKYEIVQVNDRFRSIVMLATLSIVFTYIIDIVLSLFGLPMPMLHSGSWLSIGISVLIVGVASANLLLDFKFIEDSEKQRAPAYMEWYGGFALLVTIVWLYIEILRLLGKVNRR